MKTRNAKEVYLAAPRVYRNFHLSRISFFPVCSFAIRLALSKELFDLELASIGQGTKNMNMKRNLLVEIYSNLWYLHDT